MSRRHRRSRPHPIKSAASRYQAAAHPPQHRSTRPRSRACTCGSALDAGQRLWRPRRRT
ncbi:hypothetical protein FOA52_011424 [Chlamydomonas sp. UWO 241]|nr:hypothetical protein FOA52_011424 [Chlamydomonas sp. UWO 241]